MSVQTELQRIIQAKADIIDSIEAKGVTVPSGTTIDNLDDYVDQIQQGGGSSEWAANECFWVEVYKNNTNVYFYFLNIPSTDTGEFYYQIVEGTNQPSDNNWTKRNPNQLSVNMTGSGNFRTYRIYLYGENPGGMPYDINNNQIKYGGFAIGNGGTNAKCGGNIMSLLSKTKLSYTKLPNNCFKLLFGNQKLANDTKLTDISDLILPNLAGSSCYEGMFKSHLITSVPNNFLPATKLYKYCYREMFQGCTALTTVPTNLLPATTVSIGSYKNMFQGCTALTNAPDLPATTIDEYCYDYMFAGCTSLTNVPDLPATTLAQFCYDYMFNNCKALTTVPVDLLPATTLAYGCYNSMFYGCSRLTNAPDLPATTLAGYCYYNMFSYCTSLTTAPELPATILVQSCYHNMFSQSSKINYVKCLATDISASNCTSTWLYNTAATGTFVKDASMSSWTTGTNGIPSGWTVQDAA